MKKCSFYYCDFHQRIQLTVKIQNCKKITTLDYTPKLFNHQARLHQVCVAAQTQDVAALGRQEAVGGVLEY